jgi:MFS family permease
MFGLSPSYFFALVMRGIGGLSSANNAVTKAVISDVTGDRPQHRIIAFGYHGASFSAARALASALGGLTTGIVLTHNTSWGWLANNRKWSQQNK